MKQLLNFLLLITTTLAFSHHFYTTAPTGEIARQVGYHYEGTACYVPPSPTTNTVPVFRWYNPSNGAHFWTTDPKGELAPQGGYYVEGLAYYVFDINKPSPAGGIPLYRWNTGQEHFYSTSYQEGAVAGFEYEGAVGFVFGGAQGDSVPLYRWYDG